MTRIAIMTDETGWHTSRLKKAFRARGVEARCVDLADCRIDTTWPPHGLAIPGFGHALPDAVFVRGIAGGTFEQVTLRLGILHALRESGVPVYNDARAIERSVDKSMTSFLLNRFGVPTPATWAGESPAFAKRVLMREAAAGRKLVMKPLFGSQGKGLRRLGDDACETLPSLEDFSGVAYLQRYVDAGHPGFDWRVLVIGKRAVAAMKRVGGDDWIHNFARGALRAGRPHAVARRYCGAGEPRARAGLCRRRSDRRRRTPARARSERRGSVARVAVGDAARYRRVACRRSARPQARSVAAHARMGKRRCPRLTRSTRAKRSCAPARSTWRRPSPAT